ncbi:DnaA/Hda family protein [bacterium]|nr:DnaA/Hda family protein [Mariniblastus sp.]MDB4392001.1 DnaA/Hda family protein [bacterium]MDC0293812.1 DnaA/Hda family protein [Mariniblastus sp.]
MNPMAAEQIFSVPFRFLLDGKFGGEQNRSPSRPLGLARFVGDTSNLLLKYLISEESRNNLDSQWPIVLFGPSGTGKTSLALTIISDLTDQSDQVDEVIPFDKSKTEPSLGRPIFLSALEFDRRYRSAIETDSVDDFRKKLIQSAGVIIDDIDRLENKTGAQAELVRVLEQMSAKNRPIVVTMPTSPQLCNGLSSRLVSRLSLGLSLPVNPPGPEARLEIIRELANINQINLSEDAAQLLADRLQVTVPKLNHVFAQIKTSLAAETNQQSRIINASRLTQIFKKSASEIESLCSLIIKSVAKEFDLKVSDLKSNSRKQSIVMARGVSVYLNRELLGVSFLKIGSYLGNRDHSTIMHANRKIEKLISSDSDINEADSSIQSIVFKLKQELTEKFASQINFI